MSVAHGIHELSRHLKLMTPHSHCLTTSSGRIQKFTRYNNHGM